MTLLMNHCLPLRFSRGLIPLKTHNVLARRASGKLVSIWSEHSELIVWLLCLAGLCLSHLKATTDVKIVWSNFDTIIFQTRTQAICQTQIQTCRLLMLCSFAVRIILQAQHLKNIPCSSINHNNQMLRFYS